MTAMSRTLIQNSVYVKYNYDERYLATIFAELSLAVLAVVDGKRFLSPPDLVAESRLQNVAVSSLDSCFETTDIHRFLLVSLCPM